MFKLYSILYGRYVILAGDQLRSSRRYKALDETALFGCACPHEFPCLFINLRHGEKYVSNVSVLVYELTYVLTRFQDTALQMKKLQQLLLTSS